MDYTALVKPKLTLLALATTLVGYIMGRVGEADYREYAPLLIGAALTGFCASGLNQLFEKDADLKMKRTQNRPIPAGRIQAKHALLFSLVCGALGIALLYSLANPLTAALAFLTIVTYVFLYTPLKQKTSLNTFVGAVPGALPVLMGWTASTNELSGGGWALFLILFVWQIPHFYSIAWVHKDDYIRGGFCMLTEKDADGKSTALKIILYTALLLLTSLLPFFISMAGQRYLAAAILSGALLLGFAFFIHAGKLQYARKFMQASIAYLLILISFMIIDKI